MQKKRMIIMNFSSYQIKPSSFVADTSVIINLNATEYAASIIQCTIKKLYITPQVYRELDSGKNQGHNDKEKIDLLIKQGLVVLLPLKKMGIALYEQLITGKAGDTLHDGEAATIGCAFENKITAIIDEKKATQICQQKYSSIKIAPTIDWFLCDDIKNTLGQEIQKAAIFNALKNARMNIPTNQITKTISFIGIEKAKQCRTLAKHLKNQTVVKQSA